MPPRPPKYQDLASRVTPKEHTASNSENPPSYSRNADDLASPSAGTVSSSDAQHSLGVPARSTNSGTSPAPPVPNDKPEQSLKRKSAQSTNDPPPAKSATPDESLKWRFAADKRRINPRTVAAHGETDARQATDRITVPITTTTNFTTTSTTTTNTATVGKQDHQRVSTEPRHATVNRAGTTAVGSNVFSSALPAAPSKDLPNIAADLARLCAQLTPPHQAATPVIPSGEELKQLVDAVASIECDVRAMASALQPDTTCMATGTGCDDNSLARSSSFTVLDQENATAPPEVAVRDPVPGATTATAAVALLMPATIRQTGKPKDLIKGSKSPKDSKVPKDYPSGSTEQDPNTHQTTPMLTLHTAGQKTIPKETRAAAAQPGRIKVLPPASNDNRVAGGKQWDYNKYALLPAAGSRLPFRIAAQPDHTTKVTTRAASESSDTPRTATAGRCLLTSSDHPQSEEDPTKPPQFTGIQQIIRHLESISTGSGFAATAGSAAGAKPKQRAPVDGSAAHSTKKPANDTACTAAETVTASADVESGAPELRSAGTSPVDFVQMLSAKQTQTTPKSSVKVMQDDKNMNKSKSLESQQQQNNNSTGAVMPPRSSGPTVTTATHPNAIPLPAPPSAAAASLDQQSSDEESDNGKEKGWERKRVKTSVV